MQHQLSEEQLDFLKEQKIDLKYVFNANGLSQREYRPIMKDLNKLIAFNVIPCNKAGHTLRTRSGHCCQCNTAHIAFQIRNDSSGITYVAGSINGEVIKIGFTKAVEIRSKSLNATKYAGFDDWEILYAIKSKDAGRIETKANILLHKYAFSLDYEHDGHWQDSFETFHCSFSKAKEFLNKACTKLNSQYDKIKDIRTDKYEYKNLKKV